MKNQVLFVPKYKIGNEATESKKDPVKDVANAIASGAGFVAYAIGKHSFVVNTNVLVVGCLVSKGKIHKRLRNMLQTTPPEVVKKVIVFSVIKSGEETGLAAVKAILEPKGIMVCEEEFKCKAATRFSNRGKPTEEDIANAKTFGAEVVLKQK